MMQPESFQRLPCAIGHYGVTSHEYMSLNPPLGGDDSAVCLFQVEGHAFPVLFKSYWLGCSKNSSSWPSMCRARSYNLAYRKDQETYTGQLLWCFGRDPNFVSHPTWLVVTDWKRTSRFTYVTLVPWRRERRRHIPSPQLLYHRWAVGSPAWLLSESRN